MYLNNELCHNSTITSIISGKFFPNHKNYFDISVLKNNELIIYDGNSLSKNEQFFLIFKFENTCIDLWKYSIYNNCFDFIVVFDSKYNLHLLSVRKVLVPHFNSDCDLINLYGREDSNLNDYFHEKSKKIESSNLFEKKYVEKFFIQSESVISLLNSNFNQYLLSNFTHPYKHELEYKGNQIVNNLINNIPITFESFSGFILISVYQNCIFFINPIITWSKENYIESIELKICSNNFVYFDTSKYKLQNFILINDASRKHTGLFLLLVNLKDINHYYQIIIPDWENTLKLPFNPQDNHFEPLYKGQIISLNNLNFEYNLQDGYYLKTCIIDLDIPAIHINDKLMHANKSSNSSLRIEYNESKKIILIFDYYNDLIIILLGKFNNSCSNFNQKNPISINKNVNYIYLNKYFDEKLYINFKNTTILDHNFKKEEENLKILLSSRCGKLFIINIIIQDDIIVKAELIKLLYKNEGIDIPDICSISPFINNKNFKNFFISSRIGIIKIFKYNELLEQNLIIPEKIEVLDIKDCTLINNHKNRKLIIAAKKYNWIKNTEKNIYDWKINSILRFFDLNSVGSNILLNFSFKKNDVTNLFIVPVNQFKYLIFYSKSFTSEIDLFFYNFKGLNCFFNININGYFYNELLLLCVPIGNNLFLQVTNNRIILFSNLLDFSYIYEDLLDKNSINSLNMRNKCIWEKFDDVGEIIYASKVDKNNLLIITQYYKIIGFKIDEFDSIEILNFPSINLEETIFCFESKTIGTGLNRGLLIITGSCDNDINFIYIIGKTTFSRNIQLEKKNDFTNCETGIITSIYIDIILNNIYIVNNKNKIYIYDIDKTIMFVKNKLTNILPKSVIFINEYIFRIEENLDWKFVGRSYNYIINKMLCYKIIFFSISFQLYIEIFEYKGKILNFKIKELKFPECTILTPLNSDNIKEILYIDGYSKHLNLIEIKSCTFRSYDRILPIDDNIEKIEKMIYFEEIEKLIINTCSKNNDSSYSLNKYISQIILLNPDGYLYGLKRYYKTTYLEVPKKIFFFDANKFFQIISIYREDKKFYFSKVKLFLILNKFNINKKDQFFELGECNFYNIKVNYILKHPKYKEIFVFILNKNCSENFNNSSVIKLYKFRRKDEICAFDNKEQTLNFSNEIIFTQKYRIDINHLVESAKFINQRILKIKLVSYLNKYIYLNINEDSIIINQNGLEQKEMKFNFHHSIYNNQNYVLYNDLPISENFRTNSFIVQNQENIEFFFQIINNTKNYFSITISLISSYEAKLFIFGISTITIYLYKKKNQNIYKIPANIINLLFKLFDLIINKNANLNRKKQNFKRIKLNQIDKTENKNKISANNFDLFKLPIQDSRLLNKLNINEIFFAMDNIQIHKNFISLYENSCTICFKWKLFMVAIIWWNILSSKDEIIYELRCPVISNWHLEIKANIDEFFEESFIKERLFSEYFVENFLIGSIITGKILNKIEQFR